MWKQLTPPLISRVMITSDPFDLGCVKNASFPTFQLSSHCTVLGLATTQGSVSNGSVVRQGRGSRPVLSPFVPTACGAVLAGNFWRQNFGWAGPGGQSPNLPPPKACQGPGWLPVEPSPRRVVVRRHQTKQTFRPDLPRIFSICRTIVYKLLTELQRCKMYLFTHV